MKRIESRSFERAQLVGCLCFDASKERAHRLARAGSQRIAHLRGDLVVGRATDPQRRTVTTMLVQFSAAQDDAVKQAC
jgi:hypothetical protein